MPTITDNLNLFKPDPGQSGVAAELNTNWDQLDFRFDEAGGHTHDGTPGQGPKVPVTSLATTGTPSATTYLRGDGLWTTGTGGGGGVTDHGALTGLTDDDHPQYANQSRGDARYVQKANNLSDLANTATARTNIGAAAASHQHAGADITTGTVPTARLGSGTPSTTTFLRGDQTWAVPGAGGSVNLDDLADVLITSPADNQVLSYDAAGARWINEAAAAGGAVATDPIWDAAGDLAVGSGANTAARLAIGTAGHVLTSTGSSAAWQAPAAPSATLDPLSTLDLTDDFVVSGLLGASSFVAMLNWSFSGGTIAQAAPAANHPGVLRRATGATSNTNTGMFVDAGTGVGNVAAAELFDVTWIIKLVTNDANTLVRVGLANLYATTPDNGVYLEKLDADTSWFGVTRAAAAQTRTAALAACTTNYVRLRCRRVNSTTIGFAVDGAAEVTLAATIPTAALSPYLQVRNSTAATKSVDVDFFRLLVTGLVR